MMDVGHMVRGSPLGARDLKQIEGNGARSQNHCKWAWLGRVRCCGYCPATECQHYVPKHPEILNLPVLYVFWRSGIHPSVQWSKLREQVQAYLV